MMPYRWDGKIACKILKTAKELLVDGGLESDRNLGAAGYRRKISEFLSDYGLVGACIPGNIHRDSQMLDLLSRIPSATLLCKK